MNFIKLHQNLNKVVLLGLLSLGFSCNKSTTLPLASVPMTLLHERPTLLDCHVPSYIFKDELYTLEVKIEKFAETEHQLVISMDLKKDSYYISPNAKRDFKGKFRLEIKGDGKLETLGNIEEIPLSVEEYDSHPFTNGLVNWVREDTTYRQNLTITSTEDFVVGAGIIFTIEPRCSLEKKYFLISYKNGVLSVEEDGC